MNRIRSNLAKPSGFLKAGAVAGALALAAAGCSTMAAPADSPPAASAQSASAKPATPAPDVTDCAIVTLSTPTLYACGGKVYTVFQLQHLREQASAAKAGG
ncbi:MAG TPA: hypothetical protein VMV27_03445 [Candidatus Binataceae bacterium]|nr:hypothetical protein [Candidatus Binataceae bacterium]